MRLKRLIPCCFSLAIFCLLAGQPLAQTETSEKEFEDFDYDNFDDPTNIDNEWLPLKPGTQWIHEGSLVEDGEKIEHRIEFTVTDLTKVIDGVRTVVVWILDHSEGELVEKEIAFFAQANDGTIWYLGEHPEAYEDGKLVEAASWIAGVQDAKAGIFMPAKPRLGTASFSQGWAPAVDWTDRAQVYKMGQKTTVHAGSYEDVLVMDKFNRKEPDKKLDYYVRGVGNVRVGWRGEPVEQETMELVKRVQLGPEAMAKIRVAALALEKSAYEISKDAYAHTERMLGPEGTVIVLQPLAPESEDEDQKEEVEHQAQAEEEEEDEDEDEEDIVMGERPTLRAGALSPDFKFGGAMNGATLWAAADSISNLITIEPEEGGVPAGRTVIKVLANEHDIVVRVRCYDNEPEGIVSFSKARDSQIDEEGDVVMLTSEDHILIVLDTFQDGRSGYVFGVNPSGARFDGLVIEQGEDVNSDWDTIWEAKTSQDNNGWTAEIRIPIKSLGFKKGLSTWGFNVQRRVQRLQEISRWSGAKRDFEIYQTSRAGILANLPEFDFGMGLSVRSSVVGTAGKPGPGASADYDGDISLDVTQRLGPNLLSSLTVNTDFAETEVDVRQINLTRFDLFFPEKRSFFLEGVDIFEFGAGLDEETMIPFFSRRIGLLGSGEDDQAEITINMGGKINGRVGNTNIGALVVNTRKVDSLNVGDVDEDIKIHVPQSTMGAVRLNQNILEESSVGLLATFGDQQGRSGAWSAGVDFTYRTSEFLDEKNFLVSVWALLNDRDDLEGNKSALGFRIDYPNDFLDMNFNSIRIGDGFQPSLGFVPRNGFHLWNPTVEVNPRPPWPWLRQMFFELSASLYNNLDNSEWQSYEVTIKPLDWLLESGDSFEAGIEPQGDRPPEAFEVASDVDIPEGSYEWTRYFLGARSAQKRKISGAIKLESGDYYNGDLNTIEARLALKPSAFLTLEFIAERSTGKVTALPDDFEELEEFELVEKEFTEELFGVRLLLNFSPDLQFSSLTQYETESRELGSNNRLRWTFDPFGDIFVVYNHNLVRNDENRWRFVSNQLPVKIQYTRRF